MSEDHYDDFVKQLERISPKIREEMDKSYIILDGIGWQAYTDESGKWFIRVINLSNLEEYLWLKVRLIKEEDGSINTKSFYFDYNSGVLSETLKYKWLYFTELNHSRIAGVFMGVFSNDKEELAFYTDNIQYISDLEKSKRPK